LNHHAANRGGGPKVRAAEQHRSIKRALKQAGLSSEELWLRYFGMGGSAGYLEIDAYLHGIGVLSPLECDVLAQTINERLDELASTVRALYSRPFREETADPYAPVLRVLDGRPSAPPERLPTLARLAAEALGVTVRVHLLDHDQTGLVLFDEYVATPGEPLAVDGTVAGHALRYDQIRSDTVGTPTLWVPLNDGATRLGVLEVAVGDATDLDDANLRGQCRRLGRLLGHVVTHLSRYGDAVDRLRQCAPASVHTELVRSLLPPATSGVDDFFVAARTAPGSTGSGAFDYSLSETTGTMMVLDTDGTDPQAGLIVAAALTAHRIARRTGLPLDEQARSIDETIATQFGGRASAAVVLVELNLTTGGLRYLNAGQPSPLTLCAGNDVTSLDDGRCAPLGHGVGPVVLGTARLRAGEWLLLHTNGNPLDDPGVATVLDEGHSRLSPAHVAHRLIDAAIVGTDGDTILLAGRSRPGEQPGEPPLSDRHGRRMPRSPSGVANTNPADTTRPGRGYTTGSGVE
jgi:hypothetical protein